MRFLSVCSGIEAASVAWEPLGWRAAALAEIEPFPCEVLAHRQSASRPMFMPDPGRATTAKDRRARAAAIKRVIRLPDPGPGLVPNFGDLTRFKEWPDAAIDLLVGGTPCQSFSVAGLRKGMDDPRGNLALTYLAVADRYRPDWLVWENVPGVLSSNRGRDFGAFLGGLAELGYGWAYRVLDAQFVRTRGLPRAVPQRRRRVFVVGYLGDWRAAAAVLFDEQSLRGNPPPRREAGQGSAGTITGSAGRRGGTPSGGEIAGHLIPEVCNALAARDAKQPRAEDNVGIIPVAHALRAEGFDASEDGTGRGTPLVPVQPIAFSAKDHGADAVEVVAPTLRAGGNSGSHANAGVMPAVAFAPQAGGKQTTLGFSDDGAVQTLGAKQQPAVAFRERIRGDDGRGYDRPPASSLEVCGTLETVKRHNVALPWAVRRLTPRECERLQGFPDDYTLVPVRGKPAADGPRYKALGNSMAVNAMGWIGERIALVDAILGGARDE